MLWSAGSEAIQEAIQKRDEARLAWYSTWYSKSDVVQRRVEKMKEHKRVALVKQYETWPAAVRVRAMTPGPLMYAAILELFAWQSGGVNYEEAVLCKAQA
jgi:hypothetical protein